MTELANIRWMRLDFLKKKPHTFVIVTNFKIAGYASSVHVLN